MAAPDLPVVARPSTLHCFGRSLTAINLNQSYLSHLKSDRPETCCIRLRRIENIYLESKNIKNDDLRPSIVIFLQNC